MKGLCNYYSKVKLNWHIHNKDFVINLENNNGISFYYKKLLKSQKVLFNVLSLH